MQSNNRSESGPLSGFLLDVNMSLIRVYKRLKGELLDRKKGKLGSIIGRDLWLWYASLP